MSGPSSKEHDADVIVVGGGHNGLVAACYLARAGLDVLVLESRNLVGGCTTSEILIPEAPEHWFSPCADDVYRFVPRRSPGISSWHGTVITRSTSTPRTLPSPQTAGRAFWRDVRRTVDEIRRFSARDARTFERLIEQLMPISNAAIELMATNPTRPDLGSVARAARVLRHPRGIPALASLATVSAAQAIQERFEHPIVQSGLAQLANFGSPITLEHTGINLLIVPLIMRVGMARTRGGMGMLPRALERSLVAAGGRVHTSARVDQLLVDEGDIAGVRLTSGAELRAPTVLTATEPTQVLNKWLPAGALSERMAARASHIPTRSANCAHFKIQIAFRGQLQLKKHVTRA